MAHVHYKFSSKLNYDTVLFDDPQITLRELKRQIMGRERLRAADCDLRITDAQSKQGNPEPAADAFRPFSAGFLTINNTS